MGLDAYLYLEDKETSEVIEYSYYRKFTALQGYFVDKFDIPNCGKVKLTDETIEDVYQLLNDIRYNREKANLLLPTFSGPCFGSYDYGPVYRSYIDHPASGFYRAKFINFNIYSSFSTSNWLCIKGRINGINTQKYQSNILEAIHFEKSIWIS